MSRATVELDFFGIWKQTASNPPPPLDRRLSFKGIQNAISRIDPQVLKTVIASGGYDGRPTENGVSSKQEIAFRPNGTAPLTTNPMLVPSMRFPAAPFFNPLPRTASEIPSETTAPLTIFYNGMVTVFDVHRDKADVIFKMAESGNIGTAESADPKLACNERQLLSLHGDLPIARKHSLQRFLEKRKERLTSLSPYATSHGQKKITESVAA